MNPGINFQTLLTLLAYVVIGAIVVVAVSVLLSRLKHRFIYQPLIKRLNMKPACPWCACRIPEPRPDKCGHCGTKLRPSKDMHG